MFGREAILYICHYPLPYGINSVTTQYTGRKMRDHRSEMLLTIGRTHTRHTSPLDTVQSCQIVEVVCHCHTQPECPMLQCSACQELYHEQCEDFLKSFSNNEAMTEMQNMQKQQRLSHFTSHSYPVGSSLSSI